ncbi:MAG: type II secretion system F family protein [archaeon]
MPKDNKAIINPKPKGDSFEEQLYSLFIPLTSKLNLPKFEEKLIQSGEVADFDYYLSKYFFYAIFIFILCLLAGAFLLFISNKFIYFPKVFIGSFVLMILVVIFAFVKPYADTSTKEANIRNNLSLAILGMSSIAESGAPPEAMFNTASVKSEFPDINKEFSKIVYYIDHLGLSLPEALSEVSSKTPSPELKKLLLELKSNLESGGSLPEFMKKKAEHAQFVYNLMLSNLNQKAETFGDIYSAVVIAGPLFLFSSVMLLGMVGSGSLAGLTIDTILAIGVFIFIPLINILFLIVLQFMS